MPKRLAFLISGWTKPDWAWYPMQNRFKEMGYDVVRATYPYRGFAPVQYSARSVGRIIEAIRPEYDHCTVIGHSMGGLVGRYLCQRSEQASSIDAYVSIGTPHEGTILANLAPWSKSAQQMKRGSDFLKRLDATEWPTRIPALGVQGGLEEIVLPHSSARIPFGDNVNIPFADHLSLIVDPRTFWEIWAWLTFQVFGEPGPLYDEGRSTRVRIV